MESTNQGYNGYPNYETWAVALWMDNEQGTQEYWAEIAREQIEHTLPDEFTSAEDMAIRNIAFTLKDEHQGVMPDLDGVFADLLNAAMGEVDWYFIARNLYEEAQS